MPEQKRFDLALSLSNVNVQVHQSQIDQNNPYIKPQTKLYSIIKPAVC